MQFLKVPLEGSKVNNVLLITFSFFIPRMTFITTKNVKLMFDIFKL